MSGRCEELTGREFRSWRPIRGECHRRVARQVRLAESCSARAVNRREAQPSTRDALALTPWGTVVMMLGESERLTVKCRRRASRLSCTRPLPRGTRSASSMRERRSELKHKTRSLFDEAARSMPDRKSNRVINDDVQRQLLRRSAFRIEDREGAGTKRHERVGAAMIARRLPPATVANGLHLPRPRSRFQIAPDCASSTDATGRPGCNAMSATGPEKGTSKTLVETEAPSQLVEYTTTVLAEASATA